VQKNHATTGRIPGGSTIERPVPMELAEGAPLRLLLSQPDFATAERIASAINGYFGQTLARAEDAVGVRIAPPVELAADPVGLLARVEALEVRPDAAARVAINEKTGTVVMGNDVRISTVALAHGNLTIEVRKELEASQPAEFAERGRTVVLEHEQVMTEEGPNFVVTLEEGISVSELVEALNALGVSARDMIAIFQAIHAAGALHAELVLL
jgi:flagellar P-ring protein precursor FlgI